MIFFAIFFADIKKVPIFAHRFERIGAQMAESVDALVSNTSRFTPVPVRPRLWVRRRSSRGLLFFLFNSRGSFWGREERIYLIINLVINI